MPSVTALAISPAAQIAWLSTDEKLRVWDGHTVTPPIILPDPHLLSFTSRLTTSHDNPPHIRQTHPISRASKTIPVLGVVIAFADSPNASYATFHERSVTVFTNEQTAAASISHPSAPLTACFSPDGSYLATADAKGDIRVFRPPNHLFTRSARSAVTSIAWSDGLLASAGWDGAARVWDSSGNVIAVFRPDRSKLYAIALSSDGSLLAAAGASGDVSVWRIPHKQPLAVHSFHEASVHALAFTPDCRHIASGSADGTVRLFGIPTKPLLVTEVKDSDDSVDGMFHIAPAQRVVQGQRADRRLIFVPSTVVSMACPVCSSAFNDCNRRPMCSGVCGHTFACSLCNETLWSKDGAPNCPICRAVLVDVAPNYELLRILSAARLSSSSTAASSFDEELEMANKDIIEPSRVSWIDAPELAYTANHSAIIYKGYLDGEAVAIRVPKAKTRTGFRVISAPLSNDSRVEWKRHLSCVRALRGPHLAQFYGVARASTHDKRLVAVSELPAGGSLADALAALRDSGTNLSSEGILSLSHQIVKAVRFFHESGFCGGHAISPTAIALSSPVEEDWNVQRHVKFVELGGTLSKADCTIDVGRSFSSDFVAYMAPELLDEDRSEFLRDRAFSRACQADMYSVGVLLWQIATNKRPFEGLRPAQVVAAVIGRKERPGYPPNHIAPALQDLITTLWAQDANGRPNAAQACRALDVVPTAPAL